MNQRCPSQAEGTSAGITHHDDDDDLEPHVLPPHLAAQLLPCFVELVSLHSIRVAGSGASQGVGQGSYQYSDGFS